MDHWKKSKKKQIDLVSGRTIWDHTRRLYKYGQHTHAGRLFLPHTYLCTHYATRNKHFRRTNARSKNGENDQPYQRFQENLKRLNSQTNLASMCSPSVSITVPIILFLLPATLLAAAAAEQKHQAVSAVSVLSSDDPLEYFNNSATLDLISGGRAENHGGPRIFIESFPLFGYDLQDYDTLFDEKLRPLVAINESEKVTWKGKQRASNQWWFGDIPKTFSWKAAYLGRHPGNSGFRSACSQTWFALTIAIIGGKPEQFGPYTDFYRDEYAKAGHDAFQTGNMHKLACIYSGQFTTGGRRILPGVCFW